MDAIRTVWVFTKKVPLLLRNDTAIGRIIVISMRLRIGSVNKVVIAGIDIRAPHCMAAGNGERLDI
tara:strand:- start:11789 stop:11986 length:198 start_codon:yes stop_codon:yes gene_type:complete